jgi:hypothetical protein
MFRRVFLGFCALAWSNGFDLDSIEPHERMAAAGGVDAGRGGVTRAAN